MRRKLETGRGANLRLLALCICLCFAGSAAGAQQADTPAVRALWWVNASAMPLGIGIASNWDDADPALMVLYMSLSRLGPRGFLVTVRFDGEWGSPYDDDREPYTISDFSVLAGVAAKGKWAFASIAGGVGSEVVGEPVYFLSGGSENTKTTGVLGLAAESQVFVTPLRWFGVGLVVFGNLNRVRPFGAAAVCLQLGRVRP